MFDISYVYISIVITLTIALYCNICFSNKILQFSIHQQKIHFLDYQYCATQINKFSTFQKVVKMTTMGMIFIKWAQL